MFTVQCEDGVTRHPCPFKTKEEAERFAEWGHVCTVSHEIVRREPPSWAQLFDTEEEAQRWVNEQIDARAANYFVGFRTRGDRSFGVLTGWAAWHTISPPYVKDIFPHVVH